MHVVVLIALCSVVVSAQNTTFWPSSTIPQNPSRPDTAAMTLGLKFTSTVAGTLYGVRFYKGAGNTGVHVGNLWSAAGVKLAMVTFSGETSSGWQQANFSSAYPIAANTVYTVSVHMPVGRYPADLNYAWTALNRPPLRVSGTSPGVFTYGSSPLFPTTTSAASNYFVDVNFRESSITTSPAYKISGTISGQVDTISVSGTVVRQIVPTVVRPYSLTGLPPGSYVVTPSAPGFIYTPQSRSVTITNRDVSGQNFTAKVSVVAGKPAVDLAWTQSDPDVIGYNVYRSMTQGGPYTNITPGRVQGLTHLDVNVTSGLLYSYVATAVNASLESPYSNEITLVIP